MQTSREQILVTQQLVKLGYSSLASAITKYHGSFPFFREKLNAFLGKPSNTEELEQLVRGYLTT